MKGKKCSAGGMAGKVKAEAASTKDAFKDGGAVGKFKRGGKVSGMKSKMRMDKKARGGMVKEAGGMNASSPVSSAGKVSHPKGLASKPSNDREDD